MAVCAYDIPMKSLLHYVKWVLKLPRARQLRRSSMETCAAHISSPLSRDTEMRYFHRSIIIRILHRHTKFRLILIAGATCQDVFLLQHDEHYLSRNYNFFILITVDHLWRYISSIFKSHCQVSGPKACSFDIVV